MTPKVYPYMLLVVSVLLSGCVIQPVKDAGPGLPPSMGAAATTNDAPSADRISGLGAYRLKPLDPLLIRFSGVMEQQTLELTIDENGEISLLHIPERIQAAGLTTSALETKIERLYIDLGIYKTISVSITMTAKVFYVQGEVNAPGQFQLASGTTLLQAIAGARGLSAFASDKVTITRQGQIYTFKRKKLEKDPSLDVKIEAGDVIRVWQTWY